MDTVIHSVHTDRGAAENFIAEFVSNQFHTSKEFAQETAVQSCEFVKAGSLFLPIPLRLRVAPAVFALTELKADNSSWCVDGPLGAVKGLSMLGVGVLTNKIGGSAVGQGLAYGMSTRLIDTGLSRSTYDDSGRVDLGLGGRRVVEELFSPQAMATDAIIGAGSWVICSQIGKKAPNYLSHRPQAFALVSGTVYGASTGTATEVMRQANANEQFDFLGALRSGTVSALRDGLAASLASKIGQRKIRRSFSLPIGAEEPHIGELQLREKRLKGILSNGLDAVEYSDSFDRINRRVEKGTLSTLSAMSIYDNIESLMRRHGGAIPAVDSSILSRDLLRQVGNPMVVQQGKNPTCYPAAIEHRMYVRNPDKAVDLVCQLARNKEFRLYDGSTKISLSPHSLRIDSESANPTWKSRNYAGQIFQTALPNAHWQREVLFHGRPIGKGNIRFQKHPGLVDGYALLDISKEKPVELSRFPYIPRNCSRDVYERVTGVTQPQFELDTDYRTERQLEKDLSDLQRQRAFPLIAIVAPEKTPLKANTNQVDAVHAISVRSYDEMDKCAYVHNSWGPDWHGRVSLRELFDLIENAKFIGI